MYIHFGKKLNVILATKYYQINFARTSHQRVHIALIRIHYKVCRTYVRTRAKNNNYTYLRKLTNIRCMECRSSTMSYGKSC